MGAWHFGGIVWGEGLQGCCLGQARLRTTSPSALTRCHCPGCGSQRLLRCRSHPAGRGPNSSSLFPPLAAVVAVAPSRGGFGSPRKVNGFARGSPTRGAVERSETERLYEGKPDREPLLDSTSPSRLRRATSPSEGRPWQAASFPVSFWRSLWYTCSAALPAHFMGRG